MVKRATQSTTNEEHANFGLFDYLFLILVFILIFSVGFGGYSIYKKSMKINEYNQMTQQLTQKISVASNKKPEATIAIRKEKMVNARKAGEQLADAEQYFVYGFFKTDQQTQPDYEKKFNQAKSVVNKMLVPSNKEFLTNPWLRNPAWHLKMETIVNFSSNDAPVIFTMTHEDKLMGVVTCTYDGSNFHDVRVNYTQEGLANIIDSGGK